MRAFQVPISLAKVVTSLYWYYRERKFKERFLQGLLLQLLLVVSVPYVLTAVSYYPTNPFLKFLGENYGLVTILGLPGYFLARRLVKDRVRSKTTVGYLLFSFTFVMSFMINSTISDIYYDNYIPQLLSTYVSPTFYNEANATLLLNVIVSPVTVAYTIISYFVFINMTSTRYIETFDDRKGMFYSFPYSYNVFDIYSYNKRYL